MDLMEIPAKKISLDVEQGRRIIAVSDIHADLEVFLRAMDMYGRKPGDILVILGDFLDKGPKNLETLHYVMELSKQPDVYVLAGNHDLLLWMLCENVSIPGFTDSFYLDIGLREGGILRELCAVFGIEPNRDLSIAKMRHLIKEAYCDEIRWLGELPAILETDEYIFVHSGITSENLDEQKFYNCVKTDAFMDKGLSFNKYVVVGHWPTTNYCREIGSVNPIVSDTQKIITIDGGKGVKRYGQINVVTFEHGKGKEFSFVSSDCLPRYIATTIQKGSAESMNINWTDNDIEVLKRGEEFSSCCHKSSGYILDIPNKYIESKGDKTICYDISDYFHEVKPGDEIGLIEVFSDRYLAKKDGIIGWIMGHPN